MLCILSTIAGEWRAGASLWSSPLPENPLGSYVLSIPISSLRVRLSLS